MYIPWQEHVLQYVEHALLLEPQRLRLHHGAVDEEEPEGVGAVLAHELHGVRVVLLPLAHLLPVGGQDEAVDDEVLEGRLVEQGRREHQQRVEPAPRLGGNSIAL